MGTEYGIGTGTEGGLDMTVRRERTTPATTKGFSERDMGKFIADECERVTEQLLPTMAINGDAMEDRILLNPLKLAKEILDERNSTIANIETRLKSNGRFLTVVSILSISFYAWFVFTTGVAALPVGLLLLFSLAVMTISSFLVPKDEMGALVSRTAEEAYARFRSDHQDSPIQPEVVLLGQKGLLYKTEKGLPRFVDYTRVTSVIRQPQGVRVLVDDEIAVHFDTDAPGPDALDKVLTKVVKAKGQATGEASP
ncbi:hypothetical protein [Rhizobium sp. BK176]|uniref:hypothetical protein n=1 Tax=Rhizobium sp. BK176 TaxID=2587071 RepID=UPI002168EB31|nr:hypothetical protein [Rhizobium sp. BK176]MCS4090001.1 hypothetical protein [Rhizobium sp. BK176]